MTGHLVDNLVEIFEQLGTDIQSSNSRVRTFIVKYWFKDQSIHVGAIVGYGSFGSIYYPDGNQILTEKIKPLLQQLSPLLETIGKKVKTFNSRLSTFTVHYDIITKKIVVGKGTTKSSIIDLNQVPFGEQAEGV